MSDSSNIVAVMRNSIACLGLLACFAVATLVFAFAAAFLVSLAIVRDLSFLDFSGAELGPNLVFEIALLGATPFAVILMVSVERWSFRR